ncbi:transcription termination factor Rho [Nocardioides sp.]|uniref:transcription termination factor Rho n=1 Tax=Nocardioides sp. TaxID=35761 RepID=UPI0031FED733|nr:transcription termination factor Rho [Nocardioides sp.]
MTETIESNTAPAGDAPKKRAGGLNSMLIADLKSMAGSMGISGAGAMKKAQLVEAIKAAQGGGRTGAKAAAPVEAPREKRERRPKREQDQPTRESEDRGNEDREDRDARGRKSSGAPDETPDHDQNRDQNRDERESQNRDERESQGGAANQARNRDRENSRGQNQSPQAGGNRDNQRDTQRNRDGRENRDGQRDNQGNRDNQRDDQDGSGRNRRRRGRDRDRSGNQGGSPGSNQPGGQRSGVSQRHEIDTTILEDDVLVPAAGILDVLDNYAFVRTSGYLPGPDDVYVSLSMVRKFGLRRGDAIVGEVRQPREGERKEKFNPMVRIDSVNGAEPGASVSRVEFAKLTPLYASERLRLETEPTNLIGRVIDIAAPIGKGQRGLIVSPSKAGKTMIMQSIANSITTNNPECHLMVVLVDERPEEVTDFERSVKGEVISSTFDRPASDHTTVAELAIERAKRLVELGHDVVVLLDGITRLGRAYNLAAPASGRILSGGVDSAALYPPKRFFGAARNIENGGSLTILATALVESGSKMDEVIFEEFKGTGNMEIRLRRDFADKRIFPAIDAVQSGTRREELLMSKDELAVIWKLRRVLSGLDGQQALELLLERLKKSQNNMEFLMQVQKTTPTAGGDD